MDDNEFIQPEKYEHELDKKNTSQDRDDPAKITVADLILRCPSNIQCKDMKEPSQVNCQGPTKFSRNFICQYCYQTNNWEHNCELLTNCNSAASPKAFYITNCTVRNDILCLGNRKFKKKIQCNWTGGYRWAVSLVLSITLGGFGADRFYLGHWQEGIGKLFSFGGLGVWTIIDVILISLHYLGPADGSLYI
ncbi:hypothetical protein JTB14_032224 [Gonioctena quinquepunctata]|nr:hypothetical protein JTB14_032224 [Gonioctena quinquepunctata]